ASRLRRGPAHRCPPPRRRPRRHLSPLLRVERGEDGMMTATVTESEKEIRPVSGWRVVAAKELADHLLSGRFIVLMAVLGIATAAAVFAASGGIRDVAPSAQGITEDRKIVEQG